MNIFLPWFCVLTFSLGHSRHLLKDGYDTKLKELNTLLKDLSVLEKQDDTEKEDFQIRMSEDDSDTDKKEDGEFESILVDPDEIKEQNEFENFEVNGSQGNNEKMFATPVVFYKVDDKNRMETLIEKNLV